MMRSIIIQLHILWRSKVKYLFFYLAYPNNNNGIHRYAYPNNNGIHRYAYPNNNGIHGKSINEDCVKMPGESGRETTLMQPISMQASFVFRTFFP